MLAKVFWRAAAVVLASVALACGQTATLAESSPTELLQKASTNLQKAKTAHIDGTGSFAITSGLSISFDFKLNGDVEIPDKSRLATQMSLLGQHMDSATATTDMDGDIARIAGEIHEMTTLADARERAAVIDLEKTYTQLSTAWHGFFSSHLR